jgi:hypothetical protein
VRERGPLIHVFSVRTKNSSGKGGPESLLCSPGFERSFVLVICDVFFAFFFSLVLEPILRF